MINLPTLPNIPTTKLPVLDVSNHSFDIIGNTLGRYLNYKRDTAMIEYETEKLESQTKIVLKQIDVKLSKSLDENEKNFKKEMVRLKTIAKELKKGRIDKNKIIEAMTQCKDVELLKEYRLLLANDHDAVLKKLNLMSNFDENTKLLEGV